jgi:dethiobiotin synthetase
MLNLPNNIFRKYKGVFITGTDTGVGKTIVSGVICRTLNKKTDSIGVMKPISCGDREDALFLKKISGVNDSLNDINPIFFKMPLAPYVASKAEKKKINFNKIKNAYKKLSKKYNFLIVEGVGGLLVPITKNIYIADLVKMVDLPLIIVARPGLGTINHTLLTIKCAREKGLKVLGFITNYSTNRKSGLAENTSASVISKIGKIKFLGSIPYKKI